MWGKLTLLSCSQNKLQCEVPCPGASPGSPSDPSTVIIKLLLTEHHLYKGNPISVQLLEVPTTITRWHHCLPCNAWSCTVKSTLPALFHWFHSLNYLVLWINNKYQHNNIVFCNFFYRLVELTMWFCSKEMQKPSSRSCLLSSNSLFTTE